MKWPLVPLSKALEYSETFVDGDWVESKDQDPDGDVRLIQLADVGDGEYVNKSARFLTAVKARQLRCTYLKLGDVLVARMPDPLGRACIFPGDTKASVTVVDVCIIRPAAKGPDPRWLMHCLNSPSSRNQITAFATGTTRSRISRSNLAKVRIPFPPLAEQRRIAEVLDRADALRAKRRAALAQLDSLTQSIFLDLFGDPAINPKCWPKTRLKDCTAKIQIGPFGSLLHQEDYVSNGIPIVNPKHIRNGKIVITTAESVTTQKFKELDAYHLQKDDVVMARRGEMGRCAIVGEPGPPLLCGTGSLFLRPDKTRTESLFLCAMLSSKPIKVALERLSLGQTLPNLNSRIVEELAIPLPSIPVQREFAHRVTAVEEVKAVQCASLAEMDALFASVQHCAFRGEL